MPKPAQEKLLECFLASTAPDLVLQPPVLLTWWLETEKKASKKKEMPEEGEF